MNYKTTLINNRRYLGNKYRLLPFIKEVVKNEGLAFDSFADIFSGTGAVSSAFADKQLITNDILYSNYVCNYAWFSPDDFNEELIKEIIISYNKSSDFQSNYMTENFADTYFSKDDCSKIGFIREDIEDKFNSKKINKRERALLITSLLYSMDKIAKTCGHYDAYRKGAEFDSQLELSVPLATKNNKGNKCFNTDANELVKKITPDFVYIDPPYNSRQYCDAYHLLENVALWKKPEVHGVARKMERKNLKSDYCTKNAENAFIDLIQNITAKYILLSYNNMANKGNERSNAKISDDVILDTLGKKGNVKVFSEDYRSFTTGRSEIEDNKERLFLCICK